MRVRLDRIARIQAAMREQHVIAIVVLNHDDYRYLFGTDRAQPRALIPFQGAPELIAFTGEEPELRAALAEGEVRVSAASADRSTMSSAASASLHPRLPRNGPPPAASRSACRCGSTRRR